MPSHHFSCSLLLFFTLFCTASLSSIPFLILLSLFWLHLPPYLESFLPFTHPPYLIILVLLISFPLRFYLYSLHPFLHPLLAVTRPPPPSLLSLQPLGLFFLPQPICCVVTSQRLSFFKFG